MLDPKVLSIEICSLLVCLMVLGAGSHASRIVREWDLASGSEAQLVLERQTYLISTVVAYALALQLMLLFLFIYVADSIHTFFAGAMCSVGTLSANGFGYPTLLLKSVTAILAGIWLILDHADQKGYDYPLVKTKYLLLLVMTPLILVDAVLQTLFFSRLAPDIITSCCGSLFSPASRKLSAELANAPPLPMLALFYLSSLLTAAAGLRFCYCQKGGYLFAFLSALHVPVAIIAVISVVSLYIYEIPSHHCPFCILKRDYHYQGYLLYLSTLIAGVTGSGAGMLMPFRVVESLSAALPPLQRKLTVVSLVSVALLALSVSCAVLVSNLSLR